MNIQYHKHFEKRFAKLSPKLKQKVISAIKKFSTNPHDVRLHNHVLVGRLAGLRAFSVTGYIRVVFEEHDNYILVIILDVGTHNQVY
ncbi:MAG: hypothetical protein WCW27_04970 [Patescibacteria group bacterium]|jgi:mRNA-degrading endonuclease YafQ of YafQ-DinJ toxin-antitoxin module